MSTLSNLQDRLKKAQTELTRAETITEQIQDEWEKELGTRDPEEVAKKLKDMETNLKTLSERFDKELSDAEAILDGANL